MKWNSYSGNILFNNSIKKISRHSPAYQLPEQAYQIGMTDIAPFSSFRPSRVKRGASRTPATPPGKTKPRLNEDKTWTLFVQCFIPNCPFTIFTPDAKSPVVYTRSARGAHPISLIAMIWIFCRAHSPNGPRTNVDIFYLTRKDSQMKKPVLLCREKVKI